MKTYVVQVINTVKCLCALLLVLGTSAQASAEYHYTRRDLTRIFALVGASWSQTYVVCDQLRGEIDLNGRGSSPPYAREVRCAREGSWVFSANGASNKPIAMVGVFPRVDPFRLEREWHRRLGSNGQVVGTNSWRVINRYSLDRLFRFPSMLHALTVPGGSERELATVYSISMRRQYQLGERLFRAARVHAPTWPSGSNVAFCRPRFSQFWTASEHAASDRSTTGSNLAMASAPYIYLDNRLESTFESWALSNLDRTFGLTTSVTNTRSFGDARGVLIRAILRSQLSIDRSNSCLVWLDSLEDDSLMYP